jgi:hypothetical protein
MPPALRPSHLPKIRDQLIRHEEDHDSALWRIGHYDAIGYDHADLETAPRHLHDAALYYVTQDMTALAMSAGSTLTTARWASSDRPAPDGLIWWDGGTGLVTSSLGTIPVDACSWGTAPDGRMLLWCYVSRRRIVEYAKQPDRRSALPSPDLEALFPPLIPLATFQIPVTAEPIPIAELPGPKPLCAAIAAAWLLMEQPALAERREEAADKTVRRSYARLGRPDPQVTVIDLRRLYRPRQDDDEPDAPGRVYRHRWVVSGHWRTYAAPRYSDERRENPQWIPDYIKGPDGAPLLRTERVNVWRR